MNDQNLQNIDYLREKANLSYEEAVALLEKNGGDVTRALIELEQQGRIPSQFTGSENKQSTHCDAQEAKAKATSFFKKACQTRLVVERNRENGEKDTVANLSAPFVAGVTIFAPYITLASAALTLISGYQVKVRKEDPDKEA